MRRDCRGKNDGRLSDRVAGDAWTAANDESTNAGRSSASVGADPARRGGVWFKRVVHKTAPRRGKNRIRASGAQGHSWRFAGHLYFSGTGDANRAGDWRHASGRGGYCAQVGGEIFGAARARPVARKIPESGGNHGALRRRARRDLEDGG